MIGKRGDWLVQVQRQGIRKTKRGTGGEAEAKRNEAQLTAETEEELRKKEAAKTLGVKYNPQKTNGNGALVSPTLRDYFESRWLDHANVVQNPQTRRTSRTPFRYLFHYLGDKTLDELIKPVEVNAFVEVMKETGPVAFTIRRDGNPWKRKCEEFSNATINKSLQCLQALLNLAYAE